MGAGTRDTRLICLAAFLRSSALSLAGVLLALHLVAEGFSVASIGLLIGVGLGGSSIATIVVSSFGDRWGRRRVLVVLSLLTATGYLGVAAVRDLALLLPMAFVGMLNGMGRDRGAASALEQAILPQTVPDEQRTWALAWYNLTLDIGHAAGAAAAAVPALLAGSAYLSLTAGHRLAFVACAVAGLGAVLPYLWLRSDIEVPQTVRDETRPALTPTGRRVITRLALLFGLDSIGGGFLNAALIAYWMLHQFALSETDIALLFFAARLLNATSHLLAAWLASRIGLLNTMVWTHLPSSVLLMLAPVTSQAALAIALFLAREALVEMDVPTRQSYALAVVKPEERTFASGATNVTRNVGWAVGPSIAGVIMQHVALAGPVMIGGGLKIVYDLLLYRAFKHVRPPEERRERETASKS